MYWQIFDSRTDDPLNDTSDMALVGVEIEELSSSLLWKDGEGGKKSFNLLVKPHVGWELEERFTVKITRIETQNADQIAGIDPLNSEVMIIVGASFCWVALISCYFESLDDFVVEDQ